MRILVIGCGSIGRRHIRLLREMGVEVEGLEATIQDADKAMTDLGIPVHWDLAWAITDFFRQGSFDGVIVATPPHLHYEAAREAIVNGLPVLIEKPLAHDFASAEAITNHADTEDVPVLVGYNLRYHPGLRRVKELLDSGAIGSVRHVRIHFGSYLPDWRPGTDYRRGYAAKRESGGGVILDASHELDYACWLFGVPTAVSCVAQNTGALEIETEDVADLTVTFASGVQANIHLDYLSREYQRGCTIIGHSGSVVWDFAPEVGGKHVLSLLYTTENVEAESFYEPVDDMYRAELQHFLACLRGEEQPLCTGEDGLRALGLALAARQSSEEERVIRL